MALGGIFTLTQQSGETQKAVDNDHSLEVLADRCAHVCRTSNQIGTVALIKPASGTYFYARSGRVCYRMGERVRCHPVECNVTPGVFLNLTSDIAEQTYTTHEFRCSIERDENITIGCQG